MRTTTKTAIALLALAAVLGPVRVSATTTHPLVYDEPDSPPWFCIEQYLCVDNVDRYDDPATDIQWGDANADSAGFTTTVKVVDVADSGYEGENNHAVVYITNLSFGDNGISPPLVHIEVLRDVDTGALTASASVTDDRARNWDIAGVTASVDMTAHTVSVNVPFAELNSAAPDDETYGLGSVATLNWETLHAFRYDELGYTYDSADRTETTAPYALGD